MFEIAGIAALLMAGFAVLVVLALIGLALKLAVKLILLPFTLLGWALEGILLLLALVIGVALAPLLVLALGAVAAVVAIPLLLLAGLAGFVTVGWVAA